MKLQQRGPMWSWSELLLEFKQVQLLWDIPTAEVNPNRDNLDPLEHLEHKAWKSFDFKRSAWIVSILFTVCVFERLYLCASQRVNTHSRSLPAWAPRSQVKIKSTYFSPFFGRGLWGQEGEGGERGAGVGGGNSLSLAPPNKILSNQIKSS